jgi:hypothetical protein
MKYYSAAGLSVKMEWEVCLRSGSPASTVSDMCSLVSKMSRSDLEHITLESPGFRPATIQAEGNMLIITSAVVARATPELIKYLNSSGFIEFNGI